MNKSSPASIPHNLVLMRELAADREFTAAYLRAIVQEDRDPCVLPGAARFIDVQRYLTESGEDPVGAWLVDLNDSAARARVCAHIARMEVGYLGDDSTLRDGLRELQIGSAPDYRVYFTKAGLRVVVLHVAAANGDGSADFDRAVERLLDYQGRIR